MKRYIAFFLLLVVVFLMAACTGGSTAPTPTATHDAPPTAAQPPTEDSGEVSPPPAAEVEPLFLEVSSPQDETIVTANPVEVQGRASVDAVVTVNGHAVSPQSDGRFSMPVGLEEGPNFIEVIASNAEDDEEAVTLSVIYLP